MKVAWLADPGDEGGAELTQAEFRGASPEEVTIVPVSPERLELARECDVVCVHNSVSYPAETSRALHGKSVVRYWNDLAPHGDESLKRWLLDNATNVFTSPLHRERFPYEHNGSELIPPPIDPAPFREAAESAQERAGAVSIGSWMNYGKAPHLAREAFPDVDFYGSGPCSPKGSQPLAYADVPETLAKYATFVHLPTAVEPFGRAVVEAWLAGLDLVINRLVGARYWIEEAPDKLETAAEDFWELVTNA